MSFNIALTGLSAVNEQLNTIGNNIANAGTVGFKSSRANFGSLYAESQAMGVEVTGTSQSISQGGALTTTNRSLDLAISGGGFFVTRASNGDVSYTAGLPGRCHWQSADRHRQRPAAQVRRVAGQGHRRTELRR